MMLTIETEDDYREALKRLLELCESTGGRDESHELDLLMTLMEKYERENCSSN